MGWDVDWDVVGSGGSEITIWAGKGDGRARVTDRSVRPIQERSTQNSSTQSERKLTPKQLGEIAEAEFVAKAVEKGFVVAKPWGDSEPFDFIVNVRREFNFWRVQVKSAHVRGRDGTYSFGAHDGSRKPYTAEEFVALVAYARPEGAWYVLPVRAVEGLKALKLSPATKVSRSKYEKWREGWELLRRVVRGRR